MIMKIYDEDNTAYNDNENEDVIDLYECINTSSENIEDEDIEDEDVEFSNYKFINVIKEELDKPEYRRKKFIIKYPDFDNYITIVPLKLIDNDSLIVSIDEKLKKIHLSKILEIK